MTYIRFKYKIIISKKYFRIGLILIGFIILVYAGYLYKKAFVDSGYGDDKVKKEILLGYYVLTLNLDNTLENRNKYRHISIEELEKALGIDYDEIVE